VAYLLKLDSNARTISDRFNNIIGNLPEVKNRLMRKVTRQMASGIKESALTPGTFTHPRPYLANTITYGGKAGKYYVKAARYAWFVERGRGPGKGEPAEMPPETQAMIEWAYSVGMSPFMLRETIAIHGTRPRPFIKRGIEIGVSRLNEIERKHAKLMLKGKKGG
jgi:hypothetical protein